MERPLVRVDLSYVRRDGFTYHQYPPQNRYEFERLCQLVRELQPEVIMEIGSRNGQSLLRLTEAAMPAVKKVCAIDLPGAAWGEGDSVYDLLEVTNHLGRRGIEVVLYIEDSHGELVGHFAEAMRDEVDFLFIDGDHTYEGVKQDWERFSPCVRHMGIVAFHDIAAGREEIYKEGLELGVPRLWNEIKAHPRVWGACGWVAADSHLGIGVIRMK